MKCFICPLCHLPLVINPNGLNCHAGHQFDQAKEGYYNLLPVHHKHSRSPGDAKLQLKARRHFLAAGYFSPLVDTLQRLIPSSTKTLLDIGCGEGYFTGAIASKLNGAADVYGVDIAKEGVRMAAKHYPANYAVASSFALPIADRSMTVITRIYAPSKDEELHRVLTPDGTLIIVTPGMAHLEALRGLIYDELRPHPEPKTPSGFTELMQQRMDFPLSLEPGAMTEALLQMTPFAWRLSREKMASIVAAGLNDRADFNISVYTPVH